MSLPKKSDNSNKKKTYVALIVGFGTLSGLILLIFSVKALGLCLVLNCETKIEITEFDVPNEVNWGGTPIANFAVKNTGNKDAKNCAITWDYPAKSGGYIVSDKFSLSPDEEEKITLVGKGGVTRQENTRLWPDCTFQKIYEEHSWDAVVNCENTHSMYYEKPLLIRCPDK